MDDSDITLQLRWRQTREGREDDFSGFSPAHPDAVCRIFRTGAPGDGAWLWSMVVEGYDISRACTVTGLEATPRRAAQRGGSCLGRGDPRDQPRERGSLCSGERLRGGEGTDEWFCRMEEAFSALSIRQNAAAAQQVRGAPVRTCAAACFHVAVLLFAIPTF
jgi:hypothetical protein